MWRILVVSFLVSCGSRSSEPSPNYRPTRPGSSTVEPVDPGPRKPEPSEEDKFVFSYKPEWALPLRASVGHV